MPVAVSEGTVGTGTIAAETLEAHRSYRLSLQGPDGEQATSTAPDLFECLLLLRDQTDPRGIRLGCNGARRDAWASGMARDMGSGLVVYLLGSVTAAQSRPPQVATFDPAPLDEIVTADEQRAWYQSFLAERRSD
ncbi:MAG: hypothetical protein GY708_09005 [Actinomycetia bacterium]|nr:hypothetical protein [Actinomycetes bacterium]